MNVYRTLAGVTLAGIALAGVGACSSPGSSDAVASNCEIQTIDYKQVYTIFNLENKTKYHQEATVEVEVSQNGKVVDSHTGVWDRDPNQSGKVMTDRYDFQLTWSHEKYTPTCTIKVVSTD